MEPDDPEVETVDAVEEIDSEPEDQTRARGARPKVYARRELRIATRLGRIGSRALKDPPPRPMSRGDCVNDERPCPWVACKHHLYLSVNPETGAITINFPDKEPWELEHTCALDVAERGGITLEEVGEIMNLTRERVRQIEVKALVTLRSTPPIRELEEDHTKP